MTQLNASNVSEFRKFNRFYTKVIGLLNQRLYDSSFSLTESRILFEINHIDNCTAKVLQEQLGLDRGYVSRTIKRFEQLKLIYRERLSHDGRAYFIHLTEKGKDIYRELEGKSNQQVEYLLRNLDAASQQKLIESMQTIEQTLSDNLRLEDATISIRDEYTDEDQALIIEKQRAFYTDLHGYDESFLEYLNKTMDSKIDKIWIAEENGKFAGCVGLVKETENTALLRWFIVESSMRGKGTGTRLVQALLDYCKAQQYERISLWTVSDLTAARKLYKKLGFHLAVVKDEQLLWGKKLVEERWDLELN
ncbi:GNAT family N-acetyltransferase [Paenibacillus sp. NPDC058071]|uniref:bifunctional helix-turn-helix transcriptional regulator/GNAT family N-acetyltransferase n=1 Tax=Paenibacillus sp. NPDC058071 TaxID=3346326 RepID=UPI0036DEBE9E